MTVPVTPTVIALQIQACVFDPNTLSRTADVVTENGSVRASSYAWAWYEPQYDKLDSNCPDAFERIWPQLFESIPPPTFAQNRCVCLSVTPPPFYSRPQDGPAPQTLPVLPDRWLWVRIRRRTHDSKGQAVNETPSVRAWVIDSGVFSDNQDCAPILTHNDDAIAARRIGVQRSLEVASRIGPDEPRIRLNARGTETSSAMTFTAYVPANLNNLSCVDTLDDVSDEELQNSVLSYFVLGWYRDFQNDDPLRQQTLSGKTDAEILQSWNAEPSTTAGVTSLGNRCFFHGFVAHIDYWNARSYLGPAFGSPQSDPIHPCVGTFDAEPQKIGFGATAEEALAALAADVFPDDDTKQKLSGDFFRLLKMLLLDRLDTVDAVGADELVRLAEHDATFYAVGGRSAWTIGPIDGADLPGTSGNTITISDTHRRLLKSLNALQSQIDTTSGEFAAAAETLYSVWWQSVRARGRRKATLDEATKQRVEIVQSLQNELVRARASLESSQKTLQSALDAALGQGIAEVKLVATDAYALPKEPAIALRNVGPRGIRRLEKTLLRSLGQTAMNTGPDTDERPLRAPIRDVLRRYADAALDPIFDVMAEEASLLEEAISSLMHRYGLPNGFDENSNIAQWEDRGRQVAEQISKIQLSTRNNATIELSKLCSAWDRQPWFPIFLDWEVEWFASGDPNPSDEGTLFRGRTILANRPQSLIRSQMERLQRMSTKVALALDACGHLLNDVIDWDILAQSLGGLHQQILSRDDLLPRVLPTDEPLRSLVEFTSLAPPNLGASNVFDSCRRGSLRLRRAWVVDSFGQAFSVDPVINTAMATSGPKSLIPLAPRLLEPSRLALDFDFGSETNHPIRGWILPSLVDQALIVYDGQGKPLGMITRITSSAGDRATSWRPISANTPNVNAVDDPILASFLRPLVGDADAYQRLNNTLDHIDAALARTLPLASGTGSSPACLLGRPLALVNARLTIERRGGPIVDPMAAAMQYPARAANPPMDVSIWLGSRSFSDDGVIGYYPENNFDALVRTAKLVSNLREGAASLTFAVADTSDATSLTLLMDPHGKIYFESDVLPSRQVELPSEWFVETLQKLPVVVRVAPALIHSHAALRSIFESGDSPAMASIDLPLPLGSTNKSDGEAPAILSTKEGIVVPVKPISTNAIVPELQVAAIEGILVF